MEDLALRKEYMNLEIFSTVETGRQFSRMDRSASTAELYVLLRRFIFDKETFLQIYVRHEQQGFSIL